MSNVKNNENMAVFDAEPFLKISNTPVLTQFLHECVDDLTGKTKPNFNNYNSDIEWTVDDYNKARMSIQNLYRNCVVNDNFELICENLAENIYQSIKDCYVIRENDIFQSLVEENIIDRGHNLVKNIDWRLKWIMGSSKLATLREPLLQVDLHCKNSNKSEMPSNNCVNFELNLEQLNNLIRALTDVKKELES